jgi:hypothetical protein
MMLVYDRGQTGPRLTRVVAHRAVRSPERPRDLVPRQTAEVVHAEGARATGCSWPNGRARFPIGARRRVVERGEDPHCPHDRELVNSPHRHAGAGVEEIRPSAFETSIATLLAEHLPA